MDTIVYLSYMQNKAGDSNSCSYVLKEHKFRDYRLIKILVQEKFVEEERAFSKKNVFGAKGGKLSCRKTNFDFWALGERLRCRRNRRQQERQRRTMKEELRRELASRLEERDEVYLCWDETADRDSWIGNILPFREFDEYLKREWVYRLMEEACNSHFVVLGDVVYSRELLWTLAPRMKSLLWIAPDRAAEEELEDFAEEFYQETGLAIHLQFLSADTTYGQLVVPDYLVREAVNIVDLTEGKHIPRIQPVKGSVWLNCSANLDKERRIEARRLSCRVISLRKQWKKVPFA